jgi:hypothetical protein
MASGRETHERAYTPALRFHALTGYFDTPVIHRVRSR